MKTWKINKIKSSYINYRHGPLQRTVLGQLNVQGIDYAYTLQGWLKGVNSSTLNPAFDMGEDGKTGSPLARDVYSFGLHYYENSTQKDYKPTGTNNPFASAVNSSFKSLYNGNIAAMSVNLGALKQAEGLGVYNDALLYSYRYDQLNRIKSMNTFSGLNTTGNHWNSPVATNDYKEEISYDPNGNILTYLRNGSSATGVNIDKMKYHYNTGNNQLNYVYDTVPAGNYSVDIDAQTANNYQYDAIGNLIKDNAEGISSITWNVYGKISSISKTSGTISYTYDATGNRISKTVGGITTLYVRDASGNVMSVYEIPSINNIVQKELHIYGSSRLGMITGELDIEAVSLPSEFGEGKIVSVTRGKKYFELPNHLGNVLAVVSDKRISITGGVYEADIVSATDYAPFGMGLVGREFSNINYRYGFVNKEKDNDIGTTTNYYFKFRIYNPGIGRFLSVDALSKDFPYYSPYQYAGNTPIWAIDLDGKEPLKYNDWRFSGWISINDLENRSGSYSHIKVVNYHEFYDDGHNYVAIRDQKIPGNWHYARYTNQVGSLGNVQKGNWQLYNETSRKYEPWVPEGHIADDTEIKQRARDLGKFGNALESVIIEGSIFAVTAPFGGVGSWGGRLFIHTLIEVSVNGYNADVADIGLSSLPGGTGFLGVLSTSVVDWTPAALISDQTRPSSIFFPNTSFTRHKNLTSTALDLVTGSAFEGINQFQMKSITNITPNQERVIENINNIQQNVINKIMKDGNNE